MFGDQITLGDTGVITIVGMGIVFVVLFLLTLILELFRFIPQVPINKELTVLPKTESLSETQISSLQRAIIISAILEDCQVQEKKQQVRITKIRQIL